MAIGLVPHYSVVFPIEGMTNAEFLVIIRETAQKLDWNISQSDLQGLTAYTKFRKRSVNEKIQLSVDEGLVTLKSESMGGQFFDMGRNRRNTEEFITCYDEVRSSILPEELKLKAADITEHQASVVPVNIAETSSGINAGKNTKGIFSIFIPTKNYCITPVLIDINILIFLLMAVSGVNMLLPDTESLLNWGANFRPLTMAGQSWRLLTNCFLHIGVFHLLFNMYALLYIGFLLEPRLGSWRFGIAYLVTGILASVASLYMHPMTISAGASGAIFGMYGVFLAMLTTNLIEKTQRRALLTSIAIFVGYNLLNGLKGGIDNAAHIGGLLSGMVIGYSFYPGLIHSGNRKLNFGLPAILIVVLLVFSSWEYKKIPNDIVRYNEQMKSFFSRELLALEVLKIPASTPRDTVLAKLRDRGLTYWEENKNLVNGLDKLDLPAEIHNRNRALIKYCDFRIASYELLYKAIDQGTNEYDEEIKGYTYSIDSLIKTLK